jgi:hypothetical protein
MPGHIGVSIRLTVSPIPTSFDIQFGSIKMDDLEIKLLEPKD